MTAPATWLTTALGLDLPVVLAPLGGGPGTPELAAAVSAGGGLGMLGLGYDPPARVREAVRRVRELTDRPFGVNLFVPEPVLADPAALARAADLLRPHHRELGLDEDVTVPDRFAEDFDAQLDVLLAERVPVVTFTFGLPPAGAVDRCKDAGALVGGTVTSVAEGRAYVEAGADFVIAQGAEAGGHRGAFLDPAADPLGLVALVPAVVDALPVPVPVVAAGGLMDGGGVVAALALGATAAQLGTAFLRCPEAGTNPAYRAALAGAGPADTVATTAFSGKPARGLRNAYIASVGEFPDVPPYPVMNALTRPMRARAAALGRADHLSLWAGQGVAAARELPAAVLLAELRREIEQALDRLGG